jgi:hypothetical protein
MELGERVLSHAKNMNGTRRRGIAPMALPQDYQKKFQYLKDKSDKGTLTNKDAIYQDLDQKAKNLPELRRALNTLNVNYV